MTRKARQEQVKQHTGYFYLSSRIVTFLRQERRMTLREIGELAGVSESFVSHVEKKRTIFTCKHIERIETGLGEPIALLQIEALREGVAEHQRQFVDEGLRLLRQIDGLLECCRRR